MPHPSPLAETLRRVAARVPAVGDARELGAVAPVQAPDARTRAALYVHVYCWTVAAPAIGCYLAEDRVPLLGPEAVEAGLDPDGTVRLRLRPPHRYAALPSDAGGSPDLVLPGRHELRARLRAELERHLGPVLSAAPLACLRPRPRWLLAADAVAAGALFMGEALVGRRRAVHEACALTAGPGPLAVPLRMIPRGRGAPLARWRASCCLAYRIPGLERCPTCPPLRLSAPSPGPSPGTGAPP